MVSGVKVIDRCWFSIVIEAVGHRTTALTNCEDGGMGWDRMAIIMVSQCDKTKNKALNQQTLWESISLFQLSKITFLDLSLTDAGLL